MASEVGFSQVDRERVSDDERRAPPTSENGSKAESSHCSEDKLIGVDRKPEEVEIFPDTYHNDYLDATYIRNFDGGYVINQYNNRQHDNRGKTRSANKSEQGSDSSSEEPGILYSVRVYDNRADTQSIVDRRVGDVALYIDREPIKLSDSKSSWEMPPASTNVDQPGRTTPPMRTAVCEIEVQIKAQVISSSQCPRFAEDLVAQGTSQQQLHIKSRPLYDSLMRLIEYFPSFRQADLMMAGQAQHVTIPEPFSPLMHHMPVMKRFLSNDQITESQAVTNGHVPEKNEVNGLALRKKHVQQLYNYLLPLYEKLAVPFYANLREEVPRVSFPDLWLLFRPGDDVYHTNGGVVRRAVVMEVKKYYRVSRRYNGRDIRIRENYEQVDLGIWRGANEYVAWDVVMWYLFSDGVQISRKTAECRIWAYTGLRNVESLELCPAEIWDKRDGGARRDKILRRGRFTIDTLRRGHLLARYNGPTLSPGGRRIYERGRSRTRYVEEVQQLEDERRSYFGLLVVDQKRGLAHMGTGDDDDERNSYHTGAGRSLEDFSEKFVSYDNIPLVSSKEASGNSNHAADQFSIDIPKLANEQTDSNKLTEHQLLLLDPYLRAFLLKTKVWVIVQAGYLTSEHASKESFDQLVLGEGDRRTIEAICVRHSLKNEMWAADFIEGKGKGQIVLLHGPPGVGKTYTVEAIAQWLNLPLIALTVADIGTEETSVERGLAKWFALAEGWNGIVLVDEADIFLETREHRDLERNGLVSAFLRRLEYFEGLVALTTNRPGQIDDAFVSRIHVAIQYKPFGAEDRQEIWRSFFRKLVKDRKGEIRVAQQAKQWVLDDKEKAQIHMNGRDIRNALQTAITLAEYTHREAAAKDPDYDVTAEVIVEKEHFEDVLKMLGRFRTNLEKIRGEDMSSSAKGRRDRNDSPTIEIPVNKLSFRGR